MGEGAKYSFYSSRIGLWSNPKRRNYQTFYALVFEAELIKVNNKTNEELKLSLLFILVFILSPVILIILV